VFVALQISFPRTHSRYAFLSPAKDVVEPIVKFAVFPLSESTKASIKEVPIVLYLGPMWEVSTGRCVL
jgi:hypothetical protein